MHGHDHFVCMLYMHVLKYLFTSVRRVELKEQLGDAFGEEYKEA